jgi:hypothetical protein
MDVTAEELKQRYESLETDALLDLYRQGNLTDLAISVMNEVLITRGWGLEDLKKLSQEQGSQESSPPQRPDKLKFNWAALLITPIWLLGHRFWIWAVAYTVVMIVLTEMEIGLLQSLVHLGMGIYLGVKGNTMLWKTGRYGSVEELYRREKLWVIWAVRSSIVVIIILFALILAS